MLYTGSFVNWALYTLAALIGYFSFLDKTPELLINRQNQFGESDYFMFAGKCVILVDILGSYLLNVSPCREQIFVFTRMKRSK